MTAMNEFVQREEFQPQIDRLETESGKDGERVAPDEQIRPGRRPELRRYCVPEIARVEFAATLEVQHPIILGEDVQVASGPRDANELADDPFGVGNGVKHVTANREVESAVGFLQIENALMREREPGRQARVTRSPTF